VSDTFASALWGADLMYQLATASGVGINFHGGGYGWYTPIAGTVPNGFLARPIYYGMLLFAEAGPGHLIDAHLDNPQQLLTAYGIASDAEESGVKAVVFNKDADRAVHLTIDSGGAGTRARALRLLAPRLDDTTDVTLGMNPVGPSGAWSAQHEDEIPVRNGTVVLEMPPGSAALVSISA
jgi:hypothetical protein